MRNKRFIIGSIIVVFIIGVIVYKTNQPYGNTFEARQRILSKPSNSAIILSEIIIENNIISEFIDQQVGYGYAQFEANDHGNYMLKTKMVRTQESEPIVTDIIVIGDKFYEIFMCYKSGLEYVEVIYTDDTTGNKLEPIRIEMNNGRVALVEAPEYSSYTRDVAFYDNKGNKFE
ncbi:MAG: hypothetical protein RIN55_10295 [Tissierellaceae bacterium]|nr:hypothetical protein [Tissierellaceae bacterium]